MKKDKKYFTDLISKHCSGMYNSDLLMTSNGLEELAEILSSQLEPQIMQMADAAIAKLQAKGYQILIKNIDIGNIYTLEIYRYVEIKNNMYVKSLVTRSKFELPKQIEQMKNMIKVIIETSST